MKDLFTTEDTKITKNPYSNHLVPFVYFVVNHYAE
jgi:hypothetical protein